jgi:hypothetical protein
MLVCSRINFRSCLWWCQKFMLWPVEGKIIFTTNTAMAEHRHKHFSWKCYMPSGNSICKPHNPRELLLTEFVSVQGSPLSQLECCAYFKSAAKCDLLSQLCNVAEMHQYQIWGFHGNVIEDLGLTGCGALSLGQSFVMFERNVVPSSTVLLNLAFFLWPRPFGVEGTMLLQNIRQPLIHWCDMTSVVTPVLTSVLNWFCVLGGPGSITVHSMCNLYRQMDSRPGFSPNLDFTLSVSLHQCSIFIHSFIHSSTTDAMPEAYQLIV